MKNLTKIFMAVAAGMLAFSCVTDVTEDLAPELGLGEGQQATLTLSLEESRTHLGEKAGDVYPLYWSTGDQIAINGTPSAALGEEYDGKASATFTVEGVTLPYSIVYPAPAEAAFEEWVKETVTVTDPETGEPVLDAEGNPTTEEVDVLNAVLYPVVFPASQKYVEGNIDGASAPMYGYATEAGEVPTLKHLVGLLQFNVKGEGKVLKSVTVESEKGAIAGTFYVNCEKNLLVVKEGSTSNQVSMSFGDGLALGAEATTFYVAVPAGSYGTFVATLATDTEKMTIKFNSDVKPIAAGKVREFSPFTFVHNYNDSEEFIIDSEDKLIEFARIASTFYPHTIAKVTKSLDMSGKDWTPIEGFAYTFDGGSDQGYTITGLKAPLFGTTGAKIQNLTLEGVALTSNGKLTMGSIACILTSGGQAEKASLTNCKAVGTLTVSNPEWQPSDNQAGNTLVGNYGGLVGRALGADIVSCINQVAVTVKQMTIENNTIKLYPSVAGIVGYANKTTLMGGEEAVTTITSTNNDAPVSYNCTANASDNAKRNRPYVAGVVGRCEDSGNTVLTDCQNTTKGAIALNTSTYGTTGYNGGTAIGGVISRATDATIDNCDNYGTVTVDKDHYALVVGGVVGLAIRCQTEDCDNFGAVEVKSTAHTCGIMAGGVAGDFHGGSPAYAKLCTNNAPVTIAASTDKSIAATSAAVYYRVGGVAGFAQSSTSDFTNNEGGNVTVSGDIIIISSKTEDAPIFAGVLAYKTTTTAAGYYKNYANITVDANIRYKNDDVAAVQPVAVSGVLGNCSGNPSGEGIVNEGTVTFNGSIEGGEGAKLSVGGVVATGYNHSMITPTKPLLNKGEVVIGEDAVIKVPCYVGGVFARNENDQSNYARTGNKNEGNVTVKGTIEADTHIGGVGGLFYIKCTNSSNSGVITLHEKASVTGNLYIGGIAGYSEQTLEITGLSNSGAVTVDGNVTGNVYVGGLYGSSKSVITGASNTGNVTVGDAEATEDLTVGGALNVGGVYGTYAGTAATSDMQNSGTVTVHKNVAVTGTNNIYIAGIFGGQYAGGNLSSITNSGDVNVHCNTNATQHLFVSGVAKLNIKSKTATDLTNTGNITVTGTCEKNGNNPVRVAGVFTGLPSSGSTGTLTRVVNGEVAADGKLVADKGKITVSGTLRGRLHQAGLCSFDVYNYRPGAMVDCHNYGEIAMTGSVADYAYICGLSMSAPSGNISTNTTNEGNIEISGTIGGQLITSGMYYNSDQANTVFTNCYNKGNITITESATLKATAYIMGFGYRLTGVTYNNCSNSGNITHNGKQTGGTIYMAGFSGDRFRPTAITGGLTNSGNISFGGTYSASGSVIMSGIGVTTYTNSGTTYYPTFTNTGAIKNTGKISFTGSITHASATLRVGGLFPSLLAGCTSIVAEGTTEFVNEGNIEVTGSVKTPANAMIGGIVGYALSPITGARCYCDIKAEGLTNVGWITGAARSATVKATNCAIGGYTLVHDIENEIDKVVPAFTISNYYDYIYGGTTDWTGVTNYDGCGYLSSKDAEVQYPAATTE